MESPFSETEARKSVIICDDQIHLLRAAEFQFTRAGLDVRLASDGAAAWSLIQESVPDLLICDYQMPGMSGLDLLQRIRNEKRLENLPIIMITAKCFEISREELCQRYGLSCILLKPFSPRDLLSRTEELLWGQTIEATIQARSASE